MACCARSDTYIDDVLLEDRVGALLVVRDDVLVPVGLEPVADTELIMITVSTDSRRESQIDTANLILDSTEETGLLLRSLTTLVENSKNLVQWYDVIDSPLLVLNGTHLHFDY